MIRLPLFFAACCSCLFLTSGVFAGIGELNLQKYFDYFKVKGSFVLYDLNNNAYRYYNQAQSEKQYTPASSFKICNSLIGLESGVIPDQHFVIPWDQKKRGVASWNRDHDLQSAFRNSTVWYYQELARRVGGERMAAYLKQTNYGNADTSGGIDQFWLSGGLRISPVQQIEFLRKLYANDLPFSQRSMDLVKKIMLMEDTMGVQIYAKTGWGEQNGQDIGWYVGYVKTATNVYFFANCIQCSDLNNADFSRARISIVRAALNDLNITPSTSLKITPLLGDYYVYTTSKKLGETTFPANALYVLSSEGAILIDTPWDSTQFQPLLDSIGIKHGQKPVLCLSTHSHDDRTAGLEFFRTQGINTYTSKQTYDLCARNKEKQSEFYFLKDTIFTIGNHRFETFYPGEGHTADNIVVWFGDQKILHGGCFIKSTESKGLGNVADANVKAWPKSLKRVMKRYPDTHFVIPGHFGWKTSESLQHTLKLLKHGK